MRRELLNFLLLLPLLRAEFDKLPWVLQRMYPTELADFYSSLTAEEERTLRFVFMKSGGKAERAADFLRSVDPALYADYRTVFPSYYAKLDAMSAEARDFYQRVVSSLRRTLQLDELAGDGPNQTVDPTVRLPTRRLQTLRGHQAGVGSVGRKGESGTLVRVPERRRLLEQFVFSLWI